MPKPRKPNQLALDYNNIMQTARHLQVRRQTWEDTLLKQSNDELYDILEECNDIYARVVVSNALKTKLTNDLKTTNVTVTKGTSLQLKVTRLIFGECSEQFTYARVIKIAHDEKPTNFKQWLVDNGGPAGLKKKASAIQKPSEDTVSIAKRHFEQAKPLTTLTAIDDLRANTDADHNFALALVRTDPSDPNKIEVVFGTNNISLTERVLELAAKKLPAEAKAKLTSNLPGALSTASNVKLSPIAKGASV